MLKITSMKKSLFFAVSFLSASAILTEIALTKIFSVLFFHQFAFLIISIALLGYAASGVYLSIKGNYERFYRKLHLYALSMGVSLLLVFKLVLLIPLNFSALPRPRQILYLLLYLLLLTVPFFLTGTLLSLIFSMITERANKLYFYDLMGAAAGGVIFGFGVSFLGGQGIIVLAAALAVVAAIILEGRLNWNLALVLAITLTLIPLSSKVFRFHYSMAKRNYLATLNRIEFSRWSPIFKIDVARYSRLSKIIWIDAGTNQSFMTHYPKDLRYDQNIPRRARLRDVAIPYIINPGGTYLIIGPAGGTEVFVALTYLPKLIHAVELDPVIVDVVKNRYSAFLGHLYGNRRVRLINDEGRSFLKRSKLKYDVIQEVNNCTPAAIASGVLNFSESYILTLEAFENYWDHLTPRGLVAIHVWGSPRLVAIAKALLEKKGVERPQNHIVVVGSGLLRNLFMVRKSEFSEEDIEKIEEQMAWVNSHSKSKVKMRPIYLPHRKNPESLEKLVLEKGVKEVHRLTALELSPPTDNRPFFYQFLSPFRFKTRGKLVRPIFKKVVEAYHLHSTATILSVIAILFLLSFFLIPYPLYVFHRKGIEEEKAWRFLLFFAGIGLAFIFIEIVFIKKFILFLGNPVYSITIVISSLLLSAGVGSALSRNFSPRNIRAISFVLLLLSVAYTLSLTFIFDYFLHLSFFLRFLISFILIFAIGFFMGTMFPMGLKLVKRRSVNLVPWAWGINGFFTVMGSALTVLLAVLFGFNAVLLLAGGIYLVAGLCLPSGD